MRLSSPRLFAEGIWDTDSPETVTLTSANAPINKMLPVAGKLWCASLGDIMVVDPESMEIEVTFRYGIKAVCYCSARMNLWPGGCEQVSQ